MQRSEHHIQTEAKDRLKSIYPTLRDALSQICIQENPTTDLHLLLATLLLQNSPHPSSRMALNVLQQSMLLPHVQSQLPTQSYIQTQPMIQTTPVYGPGYPQHQPATYATQQPVQSLTQPIAQSTQPIASSIPFNPASMNPLSPAVVATTEALRQSLNQLQQQQQNSTTSPRPARPRQSADGLLHPNHEMKQDTLLTEAKLIETQRERVKRVPLWYESASHDHVLFLSSPTSSDFICGKCHTEGTGRRYTCEPCSYNIHIHCARIIKPTVEQQKKWNASVTREGLVNRCIDGLATTNLPADAHGDNAAIYGPENAFEPGTDTLFLSTSTGYHPFPHELTYYFPSTCRYHVVEYAIMGHPYAAYASQSPSAWTLSVSNDNIHWLTVDRRHNQTFEPRQWNTYTITYPQRKSHDSSNDDTRTQHTYAVYRLSFTANNGWENDCVAVSQVQFRTKAGLL